MATINLIGGIYPSPDSTISKTYTSLLTNLNAYWNLTESSGIRYDSVNSNNLTSQNSAIGNPVDGCFFNGTNQYLTIPSNSSLQLTNGDFAISCWVNPLSLAGGSNYNWIIAKDVVSSGREWDIYYDPTNNNRISWQLFNGSSYNELSSNISIVTNNWYLIIVQHKLSNKTMYLNIYNANNSTALATVSTTYTGTVVSPSNSPLWIGALNGYSGPGTSGIYWNGWIKQIGLWSRMLSSTEISYLFNKGLGLNY